MRSDQSWRSASKLAQILPETSADRLEVRNGVEPGPEAEAEAEAEAEPRAEKEWELVWLPEDPGGVSTGSLRWVPRAKVEVEAEPRAEKEWELA